MNTRNVKLLKMFAATVAITAGSASVGSNSEAVFGAVAGEVPMTEAMIDAARAFTKVDVNRDGLVDIDEYASQYVVYAQLARFNRQIPVDGHHTSAIPVPDDIPPTMTASERAGLDAIARRDFHMKVGSNPGLDAAAWQDAKLERFYIADADADGSLAGDELVAYARDVAGVMTSSFPGS